MRTPSGLSFPYAIAGLCLALGLGACGESLILPPDGQPATITVKGGNEQRGRVREPLSEPLVVQVTDARGRAVQGATVAFELTSAGSEVVPAEKRTDADGLADARLVLGTTIGRQTGKARVVTPEGRPPVQTDFSALALSEDANSMAVVAGQDQAGHVGTQLDDRLVVEVTDGFGNPVEGVPINWVAEGGGSVSDAVVVTDESGRARVDRTLGPTVGTQTTLARSEGLAGSPVTFVHTALAGDASRLVVVSGSGQTAAAGSALPADLVVRLVDAEGNGVPLTAVSWVVATGGGNASPENSTTDGEGRASARWTLGGVLGEQRLDAVVSGVGVASFRATATAGAPASLVISTQPSASAGNGVPFERQPVIQVRDARGNDVSAAGIQVSVVIGSGGGELSGTRQRDTDPAGRATFTGLAISGAAGKRTLFFSAPGYAGVTSNEIDIAAPPQNEQPSAVFTVDCNELRCSFDSEGSSDSDGRIVSRRWSFGDGATSDSRGPSHTYSTGGTYQVALTVTDDDEATGSTSRAVTVGKAPDADFNWHCEDLTCYFTDDSKDDDGTITSRRWNFGDGTVVADELNPSHTYAAPGSYTVILTVTDNGGLTDDATDEVDPEAPPPQLLEIDRQPSSSADLGQPFDRQPRIWLRAGGRDVQQAGVVVTATIASGSGTLGGTTTAATDENGRAEFSNLSISGASGSHTLRFTAGGFAEVVSEQVNVSKASSATALTASPEPSEAGAPFTVSVSVTGGPTPTGQVDVTASAAGSVSNCTITLSGGSGSCSLNLDANGNLTASYLGDDLHKPSEDQKAHGVDPVPLPPPPPPPPNEPPTAGFTAVCDATLVCQFTSTSTDDGGTVTWSWDFGASASPSSSSDASPSGILYPEANTYPVTLTVTDSEGLTDTITQNVPVPTPTPP